MRTVAFVILVATACGPKSPPPPPPAPLPAEAPIAEAPDEPAADVPADDAPLDEESARSKAKERYLAGRKSYDLGDFDAAVVEFEAAYALYPENAFLFNIGQAHRQRGNARAAIDAYRRFLASDGIKPEIRAQVEAHIEALGGTP